MSLKDIAKSKKRTLQLYATLEKYDMYKRASAIMPTLYKHDFNFYNDSVEQRHQRNKKQIKLLINSIRNKTIVPQMLQYNTTNTFYPSYILNHHYSHFIPLTTGLSQYNPKLKSILPKLADGTIIGGIFDKMINVQFQKDNKVWLQNGVVKMSQNSYFYSFKTSPYIHICCFQSKINNKNVYVYVQLRDQNSQFLKDIEVRDLGATIAPDYLTVAYRFNNIKPLFVVQSNSGKLYRNIVSNDSTVQLGYSLQDLANSLYITVRYTSMRLQFATLEKGKAERPIGQYQAVTSRISDGFSTLFGLSYLRQRLLVMPEIGTFMRFYLPFMQQIILERLIDLRQCCGGHGFLQVSGHPPFLQRVSLRAAQYASTVVPQNKQIMKRVHYYSNDDSTEQGYLKQISQKGDSFSDIFYYFVLICIRMRQRQKQMDSKQYMKQFLRQACIQMYYNGIYFQPMDPQNPNQHLLLYIITKYVLQFSKYLNWSFMKQDYQKFHQLLTNKKTQLLIKIAKQIPELTNILEIGFLRNVILGESDSNKFYEKVMEVSQGNRRNSEEYKEYILKNLVGVIKESRAKL